MGGGLTAYFLPRDLHPGAWWVWALGLAVAASRTTNPWLLLTILAVACYVVVSRRSEAPWAMAFRLYLYLDALIVFMRVFFRLVFGGAEGSTIILRLPEIPLPEWAAGIRLFGAVSAESLLGGCYDGLRLATMVICVGAANALANPKRLPKAMPPALYEVGTAVIVALSVFPQLAESVPRVRRARRLRGGRTGKRFRALHAIIIPVLEDALDRSLRLAASMDSRGYGRAGAHASSPRRYWLPGSWRHDRLPAGRPARSPHAVPTRPLAGGRTTGRRERAGGGGGDVRDVHCGPHEPQPVADRAVLAAASRCAARLAPRVPSPTPEPVPA